MSPEKFGKLIGMVIYDPKKLYILSLFFIEMAVSVLVLGDWVTFGMASWESVRLRIVGDVGFAYGGFVFFGSHYLVVLTARLHRHDLLCYAGAVANAMDGDGVAGDVVQTLKKLELSLTLSFLYHPTPQADWLTRLGTALRDEAPLHRHAVNKPCCDTERKHSSRRCLLGRDWANCAYLFE